MVPGGAPGEHHDDHQDVDGCPEDEDGGPADLLDDEAKTNRGGGVADSEDDEDSADNVDTVGTCNKALILK